MKPRLVVRRVEPGGGKVLCDGAKGGHPNRAQPVTLHLGSRTKAIVNSYRKSIGEKAT